MKLENFKKQHEGTLLTKSDLKQISGGEYGDVDWDFWKRYFMGDPPGYTVGAAAAAVLP